LSDPIPSSTPPRAVSAGRDSLRERYRAVRQATEGLAAPLSAEDQCVQSMPEASPTKWHLAHTTWFFETFVLAAAEPERPPFHEDFRFLFNSYYHGVGDMHARPQRGMLTRPSLDDVMSYRRAVDEGVDEALERDRMSPALRALLELGTHHEEQHQELLLTDIQHALSCNPMRPAYLPGPGPVAGEGSGPRGSEWLGFAGGRVEIGHRGEGFAFDNEGPRHRVWLEPFELAARPVTAGDWLSFIRDGGYERFDLWLSEGWDRVRAEGWRAPAYWAEGPDGWEQHTLRGVRPIDPAEAVCHVSYYEADAFARWAGARLPREAEWEHAAAGRPVEGRFLESGALHPGPRTSPGLAQLYGDVWEWTASSYEPYPGFRPAEGAVGEYNGKFMCNQYVLRGGSCVSPRAHLRPTYRNFFPADARWQFAGLRLARDA